MTLTTTSSEEPGPGRPPGDTSGRDNQSSETTVGFSTNTESLYLPGLDDGGHPAHPYRHRREQGSRVMHSEDPRPSLSCPGNRSEHDSEDLWTCEDGRHRLR